MQAILFAEKEITGPLNYHRFKDELFPKAFKKFDDDGDGEVQGKEINSLLNELRMRLWITSNVLSEIYLRNVHHDKLSVKIK